MKRFLFIFTAMLTTVLFVGCQYEDDIPEPNYVSFGTTSGSVAVPQNGNGTYDVKLYAANTTGSDRTFNVKVSEASTLGADSYSVPATVTIPANTNEATITVALSDTSISNSGDKLILEIEGSADLYVGDPVTINVTRDCPSDLAGTYSVLTSGQSTDGAAADPVVDLPYTVTLAKTGANTYSVSDIFAGIYIDWYCEAYGYCVDTEESITDVCGNLSASFTEPFGESATVTGTVNSDGTLTISFVNGYGDAATSVYTKM